MDMPFKDAWEMIKKNIETKRREKLWQAWLAKYQHMDKQNFVSFGEFIEMCENPVPKESQKTSAEIFSMAEAIAKRDKKRRE